MTKIGNRFIGQKRNKVNCASLIIQYSNQLVENKEQLINLGIEYLFSFNCYK